MPGSLPVFAASDKQTMRVKYSMRLIADGALLKYCTDAFTSFAVAVLPQVVLLSMRAPSARHQQELIRRACTVTHRQQSV